MVVAWIALVIVVPNIMGWYINRRREASPEGSLLRNGRAMLLNGAVCFGLIVLTLLTGIASSLTYLGMGIAIYGAVIVGWVAAAIAHYLGLGRRSGRRAKREQRQTYRIPGRADS